MTLLGKSLFIFIDFVFRGISGSGQFSRESDSGYIVLYNFFNAVHRGSPALYYVYLVFGYNTVYCFYCKTLS